MPTIIGIDPGITGAIAYIDDLPSNHTVYDVEDLPVVTRAIGKGQEINAAALRDILAAIELKSDGEVIVYVEYVQAMPPIRGSKRQAGTVSSFNFGNTAGIIKGVVIGAGYKVIYVQPNAWKKHFRLTGKEKDAARGKALELFPDINDKLKYKKDHGRADALLIAYYGQYKESN